MNIKKIGVPFFVVVAIVALLVASPALSRVLVFPRKFFTELYILGSNGTAENYPFNISSGQSYTVTLGIGNQLGYCAYYVVEVKFRNETQSAPSSFDSTPSSLPSLFNITAFVADQGVWEMPLTFSWSYQYNATLLEVDFVNMTLNDVVLDLHGSSTAWNATESKFYGDLVFELWIFNATTSVFQYHERFVDLKLNMTV
ncbi:MAG: DUF1616 domain-containing protein [Candidatus Bathyarchaeia archaeon]